MVWGDLSFMLGFLGTSLLLGAMLFFSAVGAPVAFIKLDADAAGTYVRGLFPVYYIVVGAVSLLAALPLLAGRGVEAGLLLLVCAGAVLARQVLMPRINGIRDAAVAGEPDAKKKFDSLHRLSVMINTVQLLLLISVIVIMIYTRPF